MLASPSALAAENGSIASSGALVFAALVAENSALPTNEKAILADFLAGQSHQPLGTTQTIVVKADGVVCRASDVALTDYSCGLTFGPNKVKISGRKAHELYATLIEIGVKTEGAAGSTYAGVAQLACTIDAVEIEGADGGGATCTYAPQ